MLKALHNVGQRRSYSGLSHAPYFPVIKKRFHTIGHQQTLSFFSKGNKCVRPGLGAISSVTGMEEHIAPENEANTPVMPVMEPTRPWEVSDSPSSIQSLTDWLIG